jgi:hypothetical protein
MFPIVAKLVVCFWLMSDKLNSGEFCQEVPERLRRLTMPKGSNPKSLKNLARDGRPTDYDEPKKDRRLTITETGWSGVRKLIGSMDSQYPNF